jgi:hypothetical protein
MMEADVLARYYLGGCGHRRAVMVNWVASGWVPITESYTNRG